MTTLGLNQKKSEMKVTWCVEGGSSAHKLQEEEGKGIYCLSRKTFVCSWLATSHSNTNQLPLTKERGVQTHQCLNVSVMLESIFLQREGKNHRCVVCERKHFSSKKANPDNPSPRHKTTFKCSQCNVYLCIGEGGSNCFYDYHTKENFAS
ncbi:unnamed protein product [Porites lobata]|uniref:PiggyBac transposable element-derived protein 4 C-terminal zinc-ribbon domain-containing protein n=1 Tax=Porites lobata TaxID=104759 RepID=A0ABN8PZ36_9CNID|nr:unnamed protein product [Porites lobata]